MLEAMKQSSRKEAVFSGCLSLKHSCRANFSNPAFVLEGTSCTTPREPRNSNDIGTALNSSSKIKKNLTSNKCSNIRRETTMAATRVHCQGNKPDFHRNKSIYSKNPSAKETGRQTMPKRKGIVDMSEELSRLNSEKQFITGNSRKVCEVFSNGEVLKRQLKLSVMESRMKEENRPISRGKESPKVSREVAPLFSSNVEEGKTYDSKKKINRSEKTNFKKRTGSRALKCALSRKSSPAAFEDIEDLDYQHFDIKDLEYYSGEERMDIQSENVIDVIARENRDARCPIFPPLTWNRCQIKDRYSSGFNGVPSTPLLREYVRISHSTPDYSQGNSTNEEEI